MNNIDLFSHRCRFWKPQIKRSAQLVTFEGGRENLFHVFLAVSEHLLVGSLFLSLLMHCSNLYLPSTWHSLLCIHVVFPLCVSICLCISFFFLFLGVIPLFYWHYLKSLFAYSLEIKYSLCRKGIQQNNHMKKYKGLSFNVIVYILNTLTYN